MTFLQADNLDRVAAKCILGLAIQRLEQLDWTLIQDNLLITFRRNQAWDNDGKGEWEVSRMEAWSSEKV